MALCMVLSLSSLYRFVHNLQIMPSSRLPTRKKKRKCYTNEDEDAELRNDHQQKRRKISNTIAPTILVLTITLAGVCSHFMSILMEESSSVSQPRKERANKEMETWP